MTQKNPLALAMGSVNHYLFPFPHKKVNMILIEDK